MSGEGQIVPVRVYQTADRIMLAAPMPGLEPSDISVTIEGRHVSLHGRERGPHQHDRDLLLTEWALGPYRRDVDLPDPVDGTLANVTYDNGVLVLAMPKLPAGVHAARVEIRLDAVHATRGERVGHVGQRIAPSTTAEHRDAKHPGRGRAGVAVAAASAASGAPAETEPRAARGYAHVNVWSLGDADVPTDRDAAVAIGQRLRRQPGFRSYTVVRTGEHEVVAITVFDSESQFEAAREAVAPLVRD
ncbi:MAG TPA: Hsp20 family protein, partial [Candidatus Tectomicrobia bacterium]|nr:Hsp20 family protein [Candidatus Tectomicrobia bacterium]